MNIYSYNDSVDIGMMASAAEVDAQYENVNLNRYDHDASQIIHLPMAQRNDNGYRHQPYHYRYLKNDESESMKSTTNKVSGFCAYESASRSLLMDRMFVDPIELLQRGP